MPVFQQIINALRVRPLLLLSLAALPLALWAAVVLLGGSNADLPEEVTFNRHIRPILSNKCYACHGPDQGTREADLRLDTPEGAAAKREGYDHPAITPGAPERSALVHRINHSDPEKRMPPIESGKTLDKREIALLERWIRQGARWERHWSYLPLVRPEPPSPDGAALVKNPIDAFVLARLEGMGHTLSPEADPATLLRRVSFDLTGLPPEPATVATFARHTDSDVYELAVDRLLASPHYGERMAMLWLDLVRYADTDGYHSDLHRNIHAYRDYVIAAFNKNKPFDQFTREQIAGDLLPYATLEQQIASGFNRLGQASKEGGAQPEEYLVKYAADRVRTVSVAWMGSTIGCAECHDHKFDPFSQKEFYSMAAFFADVKERGVFRNTNELPPEMPVPSREQAAALAKISLEAERLRRSGASEEALRAGSERRDAVLQETPRTLVTRSIEPRIVRVLPRGNWQDRSGEIVEAGVPAFLPALQVRDRRPTRLDLADWLVSRDNPLTARVFVNHLWARFFGTGISRVLDDLGSQGEWPTHPDLLDWLAVEFVESGWDVKHMVRLIVTSAAYRQSSAASEDLRAFDPDNRYLARQSRFRFAAETVRDNALAVSGLLSEEIGGPSVKPYQPAGYWSDIRTFGTDGPASKWTASEGEDQHRRGLYTYWKRSFLHPSLMAFDAPDRQECTARRTRSNTPLQALVLLNDSTYVEAARAFAERILTEGGPSFEARIAWAFRQALARSPEPAEAAELRKLYTEEQAWYHDHREEALQLVGIGYAPVSSGADPAELAAWTAVGRAIMNLHEFVTRY